MLLMKFDGSQVQVKWEEIPLESRQGFITGYTIYVEKGSDGSNLVQCKCVSFKHLYIASVFYFSALSVLRK